MISLHSCTSSIAADYFSLKKRAFLPVVIGFSSPRASLRPKFYVMSAVSHCRHGLPARLCVARLPIRMTLETGVHVVHISYVTMHLQFASLAEKVSIFTAEVTLGDNFLSPLLIYSWMAT